MAENKYHPIDINNWDRRDLYDHFSRLKLPHFAVAAYIDVTRLLEYKRHEGLSFYLSLIYLTTKVLNGIDNFRLRIIDGQVVSLTRYTPILPINALKRRCSDSTRLPLKARYDSTLKPLQKP